MNSIAKSPLDNTFALDLRGKPAQAQSHPFAEQKILAGVPLDQLRADLQRPSERAPLKRAETAANEIDAALQRPNLLLQGETAQCTGTAVANFLACTNAEEYRRVMTELRENGRATLSSDTVLVARPLAASSNQAKGETQTLALFNSAIAGGYGGLGFKEFEVTLETITGKPFQPYACGGLRPYLQASLREIVANLADINAMETKLGEELTTVKSAAAQIADIEKSLVKGSSKPISEQRLHQEIQNNAQLPATLAATWNDEVADKLGKPNSGAHAIVIKYVQNGRIGYFDPQNNLIRQALADPQCAEIVRRYDLRLDPATGIISVPENLMASKLLFILVPDRGERGSKLPQVD